jgi:hypothetical protein
MTSDHLDVPLAIATVAGLGGPPPPLPMWRPRSGATSQPLEEPGDL